ncbi:MAG: hypothetical protein EOP84_17675, partial [Verrucomicrobiaceae bacterium]
MGTLRWIVVVLLLAASVFLPDRACAIAESMKLKESFVEKLTSSGGVSQVKGSGWFSITGKVALDGFDPAQLATAAPVLLSVGALDFHATVVEAQKFSPSKKKLIFTKVAANSKGKPTTWLKVVITWNKKFATLKVTGRTPEFVPPVIAGEFDGLVTQPISTTREGLFILGELEKGVEFALSGKVKTKTAVGKDDVSHSISTVSLTGKGTLSNTGGVPQLRISSPVDGFVASAGSLAVTGVVSRLPEGARIELNGLGGQIGASGSFSFPDYSLFDGENALTVRIFSGEDQLLGK